jgi:hypothetical protein
MVFIITKSTNSQKLIDVKLASEIINIFWGRTFTLALRNIHSLQWVIYTTADAWRCGMWWGNSTELKRL